MDLIKILSEDQIPEMHKNTPIGELIRYQNLSQGFRRYDKAQLLVAMCMDNRKQLYIPENFAYIIRTGGGNLRHCEFKVSYTIAIGGIRHIALIAHDNCGMVDLLSKKEQFVEGLSNNAGWDKDKAEKHFIDYAAKFEIRDEVEFVVHESVRLSKRYPLINVVPLFYSILDNKLNIIST